MLDSRCTIEKLLLYCSCIIDHRSCIHLVFKVIIMAFTSKNLHSHKSGMTLIKWATFFFLGMSCVLFMTKAFEIEPATRNAVQLIQKIIFTTDGDASSTQMVSIDGSWGNASFAGSVSADTLSGNTICIGSDCQTSWPTSTSGGDSVWSTWASNIAYYNLGNVGIGTAAPESKLHVKWNITAESGIYFGVNSTLMTGSRIYQNSDFSLQIKWLSTIYLFGVNTFATGKNVVINGWNPVWLAATGNVILANEWGNVGIGTAAPTTKLQVNGGISLNDYLTFSTNAYIYPVIKDGGNGDNLNIYAGNVADDNGGPYVWWDLNLKGGDITNSYGSSGWNVYINGWAGTVSGNIILGNIAGKVWIGTTSPSELLHVNGNTKTTKLAVWTGIDTTYWVNIVWWIKSVYSTAGSSPNWDIYTNNGYYETYLGKYKDENDAGTSNYGMIINDLSAGGMWLRVVMQNPAWTAASLIGRVWIGTASPSSLLHLSWSTNNITLQNSWSISAGSSSNQLYLWRNGNVGIGTASPSAKLTVSWGAMSIYWPDGSTPDFQFQTSLGNVWIMGMYHINSLNDNMFIGWLRWTALWTVTTGGTTTNTVFISTGGKVGIGTTNPTATLTVNGGMKMLGIPSNPCAMTSDYPEWTMFYNSTNKYFCFCDNTTTAKALDNPGSICYF